MTLTNITDFEFDLTPPKFEIGDIVAFKDRNYNYPSPVDIIQDWAVMWFKVQDLDYRLEYDGWSYILGNQVTDDLQWYMNPVIMREEDLILLGKGVK